MAAPVMVDHRITSVMSPADEMVFCSCGWRHTVTRRQNALARAAKVRAAIRRHCEPCWNCDGTGEGRVWNTGPDADVRQFVPGPCVVCSGSGKGAR